MSAEPQPPESSSPTPSPESPGLDTTRHIQTDGGAYVEGNVHTGGDFVGRDQKTAGGHIIEVGAGATANVIINALQSPARAEAEPPEPGESPFKGLQYFDERDADLFFGREQLTAKLVNQLRRQRFLAVVGASGSGKSSLVRAGLIPALRGQQKGEMREIGEMGESARWPIHIITPTAHPLKELAASLTCDSESVTATATLMDDLARDPRSLDLAVARRLKAPGGGPRLLLVVDQFEELFTLCRDDSERRAFVDNLVTATSSQTEGPTIAVLTLRADFYAFCAQYDSLREAVAKQQEYIGPMTTAELRRAIEGPAQAGGWDFEPGLVDLLLRDVGSEPGALPLLSHALLETWKRRSGRTLTLKGYTASGGVRGAIAHTAEAVFNGQLTPEQQPIARSIFLRLTELGEGTQDTRRRAALSELTPTPEKGPAVAAVLKVLADARLVTTSEETAEVAHEALIREWPALRRWLEEDREGLRLGRHLTEAAAEWARRGRKAEDLYRGTRLAQAGEWAKTRAGELSEQERAFLNASKEAKAKECRAAFTRRLGTLGIVGAALVAVGVISTLALTGNLNRFIYGFFYPPLPMEWVDIPAGEFRMGSDPSDPVANDDEKPPHRVYLDAYQIGKYEVTNEQYAQCVNAKACNPSSSSRSLDPEFARHPVVYVDWDDATTFCQWNDYRSGRLLTEAEWEKAASWDEGSEGNGGKEGSEGRKHIYPWGDEWDVTRANVYDENGGVGDTTPVGQYSPGGDSYYGVADMAGNVWEWVADWYAADYYQNSPAKNPTGPESGDYRGLRGGAFGDGAAGARAASRYGDVPVARSGGIGFRCGRGASPIVNELPNE